MTVGQWLDTWQSEYLANVKPSTVSSYEATIRNHLQPGLGAIRLDSLTTHDIQEFYNILHSPTESRNALSSKTIKNIHGSLHHALEQAIKGHKYENMFLIALFTGMRQGEVCGLQWECVDFDTGTILIDKQLQSLRGKVRGDKEKYALVSTKNGKERTITAAPFVMDLLWKTKQAQDANRNDFGSDFLESGLVFTDEIGNRVTPQALYRAFKLVVTELNMKDVRFHDLRHSYAVVSLKSGDDVKTVQENLGHATASFTLDTYGHVTEKMKKDSADRMQAFIKSVS
jgi:integrase